LLKYH